MNELQFLESSQAEKNALVIRHIHGIRVYDSWEAAIKDSESEFKGYPFAVCEVEGITICEPGPTHQAVNPFTDTADALAALRRVCTLGPKELMRKCELHWFPAGGGRVACLIFDWNHMAGQAVREWEAYGDTLAEALCTACLKVVGVIVDEVSV